MSGGSGITSQSGRRRAEFGAECGIPRPASG
jgi:hypothetical protein